MNENYQYSSHMFRKTRVYSEYQEGVEKLKDELRKKIGQAKGSTALNSYITLIFKSNKKFIFFYSRYLLVRGDEAQNFFRFELFS